MAKQHVQIPHNMTISHPELITSKELLVYASIKRYQNKNTNEAFPSMNTISKHCGWSRPTVAKMIGNLEEAGYIKIKREQTGSLTKNIYQILKTPENFERFDLGFLDDASLTAEDKSTILALQQEMLNKNNGDELLPMTLNDIDACKYLNCSMSTLKRRYKSLIDKNILSLDITQDRDYNGLPIVNKYFNMKINALAIEMAEQREILDKVSAKTDIQELRVGELERQVKLLTEKLNETSKN